MEDLYNQVMDYFASNADINSGLTAFPTLLIPTGGSLEGMGTAYTAVARDTGFMEANPAASSSLPHPELAFLHHNWIADSKIEGIIFTSRLGDMGFGFGGKFLYMPFDQYQEWGELVNSAYLSETIATINLAYNFFSSYAFEGIAIGGNLKLAHRHIPAVFMADQSAIGIMGDFGILTRFDLFKFYYSTQKNFSIGAAIKNIGYTDKNDPLPTLFTAGLAYALIKPVTLAVDFNLPVSFDPVNYPAGRWYLAAGLNINFARFFSIQSGIRIKENPMISLGCNIDMGEQSLTANYNLDLSGRLNPVDKFSVEVKFKLGYKERLRTQQKLLELYSLAMQALSTGDYRLAIVKLKEVLEIDPKYAPAQKYLDTAQTYLKSQELIKESQQTSE
jgi:hypothetical protein